VVAAYGRLLPDEVLAVPRLGFVNIHASLLPKYRGASPIQRALIAGERETGVSIMRVVTALDAGPVFATRARPIRPDETAAEAERDLAQLGAALLIEVVDGIARGDAVEQPQDDAGATYAAKLTKEEAWLDWTQPAQRLHDRVRGLQPWPNACTSLHGRRYLILRTQPLEGVAKAIPGTILEAKGDSLVAAAGDGTALRLLQVQPEGKRALGAREFLAGHKVQVGDRFEGGSPP
jgi:methionyl-tRNA formyltransferase